MRRYRILAGSVAVAIAIYAGLVINQSRNSASDQALNTIMAYLRATYARNFSRAYDHVSAVDQQVRPQQIFVTSQGAYRGFTLEVAEQLAGFMEIWSIDRQTREGRLVIKVGYRAPAPAELNELLLNWDEERLNALSVSEQKAIIAELDNRKKTGKLLNIEGQETIELVEEPQGWKIFLDWAADTRVLLLSKISGNAKLDVRFSNTEVMAKPDELFLVNVKIKNPSTNNVIFTVNHLLEPLTIADDLQLVECGLLTPTTIEPQQEKEFAMAYLLASSTAQNHREIKLTYEFKLQ